MSDYTVKQASLSRVPCSLVVMTIDKCSLTYGTAPCTATAADKCYNTFPTCRDRANYARTTQDLKFTSHEAPLPFKAGERPYVRKVDYLPTEIKTALSVRGRAKVEMVDEPDADVGVDPYLSDRTTVPVASYWKKFLARNGNFKGRPLKIYDGFIGLTENDFTTEGKRFTGKIDNMALSRGRVSIEAVDLLASLSDVSIPEKLNIKLATDIAIDATQATLSGDDVSSLDAAPGYVRIDDELIKYDHITYGTKIISSLTRGAFGTTAATHNENGKVQKCRYYAADNPFDTMLTILDDGGIAVGDIDATAFTFAKDFDGDQNVAAVISEPVKASDLFFELVGLMNCKAWVSEDLKITIARDIPNHPDWTYSTLTDAENLIQDSASVDLNQKSLLTRVSIYWQKDPTGDEEKVTTFARLNVAVDTDAEGASEYDQESEKVIYSRWLDSTLGAEDAYLEWVAALAARIMWPHRDPMPILEVDVEIKDSSILTGDVLHVSTDELCDRYGNDFDVVSFQVIKREKNDDSVITLKLLRLTPKRILFITPDDAPDYADATETQREQYGYISDDNGQMADGKDGYVIF